MNAILVAALNGHHLCSTTSNILIKTIRNMHFFETWIMSKTVSQLPFYTSQHREQFTTSLNYISMTFHRQTLLERKILVHVETKLTASRQQIWLKIKSVSTDKIFVQSNNLTPSSTGQSVNITGFMVLLCTCYNYVSFSQIDALYNSYRNLSD